MGSLPGNAMNNSVSQFLMIPPGDTTKQTIRQVLISQSVADPKGGKSGHGPTSSLDIGFGPR